MIGNTASAGTIQVEEGVWVVVLGELCVFTLFFATFLYYRAQAPLVFEASSETLNQGIGALYTLLLLASSWCVASAIRALSSAQGQRRALPYLYCALLCGAAFVVVKGFEYSAKFSDGVTVLSNNFYMFYFMLTGIHLLHLLVGMVLLWAATLQVRTMLATRQQASGPLLGFASCFWHMVDILWLILFPLLYLLR